MKKLNDFLQKIDFFMVLLQSVWGLLVAVSIFAGYEDLVIHVPFIAVLIGSGCCIAASVFLQKQVMRDPRNRTYLIRYTLFNYGVPVLISILKFFLVDVLYSFGGFMPGLAALGLAVAAVILGGIALIGCAVFWITWGIRRRLEKKGRSGSGFGKKVGYVLNIVSFWAILIAVAVFLVGLGTESLMDWLHRMEIKREQDFLEERYEALRVLTGADNANDAAYKLLSDSNLCAMTVEMMAKGSSDRVEEYSTEKLVADLDQLFIFAHVTEEVLEQGRENYLEFTERYEPVRGVEFLNQSVVGDLKQRTVSVSAELDVKDLRENGYLDSYIVITFDEDWNIIRVGCQTEQLRTW